MNKPATFGQRLGAMLIDALVFLPLIVAYQWLESFSKVPALVFALVHTALGHAYPVYGHGRFGKTVGKWVMGIRVLRVNGESLRWREAWLRSAVDLAFGILATFGYVIAMRTITDAEYYGVGWSARNANLMAHQPAWTLWAGKAGAIWLLSEVVTMLFNKRRRALHDLIGGTVVLSDRSQAATKPAA